MLFRIVDCSGDFIRVDWPSPVCLGSKYNSNLDFERKTKELERSFCPGTFEQWLLRIVTTAKDLCNDSGGKRIKLIKSKDSITYNIKPKDKEAIDCIIRSIRIYLVLMPPHHQEIFRKQIPELEKFKSTKKSLQYGKDSRH